MMEEERRLLTDLRDRMNHWMTGDPPHEPLTLSYDEITSVREILNTILGNYK